MDGLKMKETKGLLNMEGRGKGAEFAAKRAQDGEKCFEKIKREGMGKGTPTAPQSALGAAYTLQR